MFSQQKQDDQELLLEIAEMILVLVKVGTTEAVDLAEKFGEDYTRLQEKIKTTSYDTNNTGIYNNQTLGALWPQSCPHQQQESRDR